MKSKLTLVFFFVSVVCVIASEESTKTTTSSSLIEQGRTMVHHAVKRFMIILPAIFFKLGIAFTLLILIALAAVNNGFIGFLLLVVGMSSVLARLQGPGRAPVVPYISPLPPYHQHVWDRSDSGSVDRSQEAKTPGYAYSGYSGYNPQMTNYYNKYATSKL